MAEEKVSYYEIRRLVADRLEIDFKPLMEKYDAEFEAVADGKGEIHNPTYTPIRVAMLLSQTLHNYLAELRAKTVEERLQELERRLSPPL